MKAWMKPSLRARGEMGLGLMEVIVGVLVALIVGSILLHLCRLGYAMYELHCATSAIAAKLESARGQALSHNETVSVIFNAREGKFGLDNNRNGKLENAEAEELPTGVSLSEDAVVSFSRSGSLAFNSKQPHIVISNNSSSHNVSVSSVGVIEID